MVIETRGHYNPFIPTNEQLFVKQIPIKVVYKKILNELLEKNEIKTILIIRTAAETGMCRGEIAEARIDHLDMKNPRSLYLSVAKRIKGRRAKESKMRIREIPLHLDLYKFILENIDREKQKYIIPRKQGNFNKPFNYRYLYHQLEKNNLNFTIHHLRHYFKSQVWSWMIQNKQPDPGLLKEIMGHAKTVHESYGRYSWDYKLSVVDSVFCEKYNNNHELNNLQEAITTAIKNGFDSQRMREREYPMREGECPYCRTLIN